VSDFPEEQLLVAVFPGVPTAAELFLLPNKNQSEGKKKSEEQLEQVAKTDRLKLVKVRFSTYINVLLLLNRRPASLLVH